MGLDWNKPKVSRQIEQGKRYEFEEKQRNAKRWVVKKKSLPGMSPCGVLWCRTQVKPENKYCSRHLAFEKK